MQLFYWSSRKSFVFFIKKKLRHSIQTTSADRHPGQEPQGSPQLTINQIWRSVEFPENVTKAQLRYGMSVLNTSPLKGKIGAVDAFV